MNWVVNFERDSVCMGDDVNAPNASSLTVDSKMQLSQFFKLLAEALPSVSDPEPIVWSVHSGDRNGVVIGLIETVFQVRSKAILFVRDRNVKDSSIGKLYCRYYHKNSLMRPDEKGVLRIPMYPECPTLVEKVMKHLHVR